MDNVVLKFCIGLITSVAGFVILKNVLKSDERFFCWKNICLILLMTLPTILFYKSSYYVVLSILMYFFTAIIYKYIFKLSLIQAFLVTGIMMIIIAAGDALTTVVFIPFTTVEKMRSCWYIMIPSNLCVATIAILISRWRILQEKIFLLIEKIDTKKYFNNIVFIALFIVVISTLFYNVSETFSFNSEYIVNLSIMFIFFLLTYIYLREQYNYDKLTHEYDMLFKYVENFEEWVETEQLNRHELKNNLGAIRNITKDKKIIEKIDDILKDNISIEDMWIEQLKYVPKGILKGLLYYKMAIAKNQNINMITEISSKSTKILKELNKNQLKQLTQLMGIYLDNAIEAAETSIKKKVCIEIYAVEDDLNIVISNTFSDMPNILEMNKKGQSTKGKGRGNGLYFAKKIIDKSDLLIGRQQVIDDLFIQKLMIKFDKKDQKK